MKKLLISKIVLLFGMVLTSCSEEIAESNSENSRSGLIITVRDANTRAAYSGYTTTFEAGDRIGLYVVDGTSVVNANVLYEFDGTDWSTSADVQYSSRYTYYAYYPYVASPYTPDFTQAIIDDKFDLFINDASNKFHRTDQSTKANFQASDFMLAQGVAGGGGAVSFAMHHKKGLAVFDDDGAAEATFTGNIPYLMSSTKYFLMKPGAPTTFTDDRDTYTLYASSGKYKTHSIVKELVDLGLPSGTLWASGNIVPDGNGGYKIGKRTDYGAYFSFGNVVPHFSSNGSTFDDGYDWGTETASPSYSGTTGASIPYTSQHKGRDYPANTTYDAARACLGGTWQVPTATQFKELCDNTDNEWTTINGVKGTKFMKPTDHSVYIFFPAAGDGYGLSLQSANSLGYSWSSSLYTNNSGYRLYIKKSGVNPEFTAYRFRGLPVRPVK